MFSPLFLNVPRSDRARRAAAAGVRPEQSYCVPQTIDEAYDMRLLAEVARWDDQSAYEELYARHHAAVTRVAMHVCRNTETAQDITQQTFTALWVRAQRLVDKAVRLRPWLTTVARNAAIDHLRSDRATLAISDAAATPAPGASPEHAAVANESTASVAAALAKLSAEQRTAIQAVYFAGQTYAAAAHELGEPVGTIKSRVRLALGHLRHTLASGSR
jgi:RNA polymerase sigma-70 factor (ECF subfamily)